MPCARSRSARVAMSVHPDPQPQQLGLIVLLPAFLTQPVLRLRAKPRLDPLAFDVSPKAFGAGDNVFRIDAALDRRLEFLPRGLFRIRKFAAVRVDVPESLKVAIGTISHLNPALDRSMHIDRMILVLTGSGELRFGVSDLVVRGFW